MRDVPIDEDMLKEIVRRLVAAVNPDRIILFGSRARGDAKPDSDVDLLVIKDSDEPPQRRVIRAYRALSGLGIPKDILWRTPAEIAEWSSVRNYVTTEALREGRVLYEKQSCSGPKPADQGVQRPEDGRDRCRPRGAARHRRLSCAASRRETSQGVAGGARRRVPSHPRCRSTVGSARPGSPAARGFPRTPAGPGFVRCRHALRRGALSGHRRDRRGTERRA